MNGPEDSPQKHSKVIKISKPEDIETLLAILANSEPAENSKPQHAGKVTPTGDPDPFQVVEKKINS